jgi:hypothetical protein
MADVPTIDGRELTVVGVNGAVVFVDPKPDGTGAAQVFVRRGKSIPGRITEDERKRLEALHVFEEGRPNPVLTEPEPMIDQSVISMAKAPGPVSSEEPRARVEPSMPLVGAHAGIDRNRASAGGATGLTIPSSDEDNLVVPETAGTPKLDTERGPAPVETPNKAEDAPEGKPRGGPEPRRRP